MRFIISKGIYCLLPVLLLALYSHSAFGQDQEFVVRGTVYSAETGMPLAEIGISAMNSPVDPVSTDTVGAFEITLPGKNEQLFVSYPGYKGKTVFVHGRPEIDIWLLNEGDLSVGDATEMLFREVALRDIAGAAEVSRRTDL